MIPDTATEAEAAREAAAKSRRRTLEVLTPKVSADLKPKVMIFRSVAEASDNIREGIKKTRTSPASSQVLA
jgi:hypothetical protein